MTDKDILASRGQTKDTEWRELYISAKGPRYPKLPRTRTKYCLVGARKKARCLPTSSCLWESSGRAYVHLSSLVAKCPGHRGHTLFWNPFSLSCPWSKPSLIRVKRQKASLKIIFTSLYFSIIVDIYTKSFYHYLVPLYRVYSALAKIFFCA